MAATGNSAVNRTSTTATEPAPGSAAPRRALSVLSRLRQRLRKTFVLDGVVTLFLGLLLVLAMSFLLDYFVRLPLEVRCVLLLAGCALMVREAVRRLYRPLAILLRDDDLAVLVERAHPELKDSLLTAVQLTRARNDAALYTSRALLDSVVETVEQRASQLRFQKVFDLRILHRKFVSLTLVALVVFVGCRVEPELASIWAQRNLLLRDVSWPRLVQLQLLAPEPGPIVVAVGGDLPVAVRAERGDPSMVVIRSVSSSGGGGSGTERVDSMAQSTDGVFRKTFTNVARPFEFSVEGGDDALGPYAVSVRLRPRIDMQSIRLWFEYPGYLGMASTPADEPVRFGNIKVPVGTRVRFSMASNVDVRRVYLVLRFLDEKKAVSGSLGSPGSDVPGVSVRPRGASEAGDTDTTGDASRWPSRDAVALEVQDGREFSGEFVVEASGHYYFGLETPDGFRSRRPDRFRIQAIPDRAPDVRVLLPERLTEEVTPSAKVDILVRGSDDYGVEKGSVEGNYFAPGTDSGVPHSFPLEVSRVSPGDDDAGEDLPPSSEIALGGKRCRGRVAVDVASLGNDVTPTARFQFYVELRDYGGNVGESEVYYLRVVDPEELSQILNNRLMVVRDRLVELRRQQESVRKDVEAFQEDVSLKGQLSSKEAHRLFRFERDQERIRRGLERERDATSRILQRAVNNEVGDESWRSWVRARQGDLTNLAQDKAAGIETALREVKEAADRAPQSPRELQRALSRQIDLENDLEMLILQLSEYGDINALIQRLRDIRRAQTDLRQNTRAIYDDAGVLPLHSEGGTPRL